MTRTSISMTTDVRTKNNKVVLGFSGGVDSTAAALLLQEEGYDVTGVFMDVLGNDNDNTFLDAEKRAKELGIPLTRVNAQKRFSDAVIADFCTSYQNGLTPNPCVVCNPEVKFRTLFDFAKENGIEYVATGHYARIFASPENAFCFKRALCEEKDQTYMLWGLYSYRPEELRRILFPLGSVPSKDLVRSYVESKGIGNFSKKDSQDICFIPKAEKTTGEAPYLTFLEQNGVISEEGLFCNASGDVIGSSKGYLNYTIGQRKGFGMGFGKPMFVTGIDAEKNRVTLGDESELFRRKITLSGVRFAPDYKILTGNYFGKPEFNENMSVSCDAKIRYRAKPASCTFNLSVSGTIDVLFNEPQRAPTPGQSCVLYKDDLLIGGGIIL